MNDEIARSWLVRSAPVAAAQAAGRPVVALESTIIAHGMPYPRNVETLCNRISTMHAQSLRDPRPDCGS